MIETIIQELESRRKLAETRLQELNSQFAIRADEYQDIEGAQQREWEDEIDQLESNLHFIQKNIVRLDQQCQQLLAEKKKKQTEIEGFEKKKEKLNEVMKNENAKLIEISRLNARIESEIKVWRDELESCQEQFYDIDLKGQNLKRFGWENVPQAILDLCEKKQFLAARMVKIQLNIEAEKNEIGEMIPKQKHIEINEQISELTLQAQKITAFRLENQNLQKVNELLNESKSKYEWNPNIQIKKLQESLHQQEKKISSIQKEISSVNKKSVECLQKIQEYKNYASKEAEQQKTEDKSKSKTEKKEKAKNQSIERLNTREMGKQRLYFKIKQDLENEKEKDSLLDKLKKRCQRQPQKKEEQQSDSRTFRNRKSTNLIQFWFLMIVLGVLTFWAKKYYKKDLLFVFN